MIDIFLKAATEAELKDALPWLVNQDGEWIRAAHQWALDPIGDIMLTPPTYGPDMCEETPAAVSPGYHANLRLLDEALADQVPASVQIAVNSPSRVWA